MAAIGNCSYSEIANLGHINIGYAYLLLYLKRYNEVIEEKLAK